MALGFSERVKWSRKTYTLSELVQRFETQFPVIVNTFSGFYGANEVEVISAGQIIRIHSVVTQRRVFARDVRGRIFSLPLNLTVKFEALKENGRKSNPKRLAEILEKCELPTRVAFADHGNFSFSVGETRYNSGKLGTLTLYKLYEEQFLRVNNISRGAINKSVVLLPLYLQIQVSLAKGFKDGQIEDWESLLQMYDRSIVPSKISTIKGLDDILVYDPTDGDVINPQAIPTDMARQQNLRSTSVLVECLDSSRVKNSLTGRLSALKIFGNKESKRMAKSVTENRRDRTNRPCSGNKIVQSKLTKSDLQEGEFVQNETEAETTIRKTTGSRSSGIQNSRLTKITLLQADKKSQVEHESHQMTVFDKEDGEVRDTNIETNIEARYKKSLDSGIEQIRQGENQSEIQLNRPKPLEGPIPAKRTSAPTGRVTPMVKESSNASRKTDLSVITVEVNQTVKGTSADFRIMADSSTQQYKEREQKPIRDIEEMEQRFPFSDSGDVDARETDGNKSLPRQAFNHSVSSSNQGTIRTTSRSKKSALKADLKKSTPTKRHVSYSDTDTVYPFDSYDDMADDTEVDGPFYSNMADILAENLHSRMMIGQSRNLQTLPAYSMRRTESMVGSVLPTTPTSVWNKNSLPTRRKYFHGSDTNIFSRSSTALYQNPSIEIIPEAFEEHQVVPTGTPLRQYDVVASKLRTGDLNTCRKYGSSVINVGNARSEGSVLPRRKRTEPVIAAVGDTSFIVQNYDASPRRNSTYRATTSNRKPLFELKQDVIPYGGRYENKTLMPLSTAQRKNSFALVPLTGSGRPVSNFVNHPIRAAENHHQNSSGKVIRLNENRDGSTWDEISDFEVEKLDQYSRKVTVFARPPDPKYPIYYATKSRFKDSIGSDFSSSGKNHVTYLSPPGAVSTVSIQSPDRRWTGFQGKTQSIYDVTRETIPRFYTDNQNVTRRVGVVTPTVVLMEKAKPVKKSMLFLE